LLLQGAFLQMNDGLGLKRKIGLAMLAAGLVLALACHLLGSRGLMKYGGGLHSLASDKFDYDVPYYEAHPKIPEVGRVVIYPGWAGGVHTYYPLAASLLRSGYAVRLVARSGSPNSSARMNYSSHGIESMEATQPFFSANPDVSHFVMGHSEGTRFALQVARKIPSVDGVILLATIASSMDTTQPANVLILVGEDDFARVKQATRLALKNGTAQKRPEYGRTYGSVELGTARMAKQMPGTDHLSVALAEASHVAILSWLDEISGNTDGRTPGRNAAKYLVLAVCSLLGTAVAVIGVGLLFPPANSGSGENGMPAWAFIILLLAGWGLVPIMGNSFSFVRQIPLLIYGRVLVYFAIASVPFVLVAAFRPRLGAGIPRGSWKARVALLVVSLTLLLFDCWLVSVIPSGARLGWFLLAAIIPACYFLCEEFFRRKIQLATDWQTGFALGLAGSFIAALSIAAGGYFVGSMDIGQYLIVVSATLFVLLAACEIPATYLFATTGDWLLSWWVRASIFNGFIVGIVPFISEIELRQIIP
jgi:pimeloyl-ACP methyl ester carboxylesterase